MHLGKWRELLDPLQGLRRDRSGGGKQVFSMSDVTVIRELLDMAAHLGRSFGLCLCNGDIGSLTSHLDVDWNRFRNDILRRESRVTDKERRIELRRMPWRRLLANYRKRLTCGGYRVDGDLLVRDGLRLRLRLRWSGEVYRELRLLRMLCLLVLRGHARLWGDGIMRYGIHGLNRLTDMLTVHDHGVIDRRAIGWDVRNEVNGHGDGADDMRKMRIGDDARARGSTNGKNSSMVSVASGAVLVGVALAMGVFAEIVLEIP